jgi:tRNA nucleotidyltransferase (CCA-adding enzyme)
MELTYEEVSDQIIRRICECGWKAYLCGGAVRDNFLDITPHDYDIVTDATPDELEKIFHDRKVKTVGANFLVTLIDNIEVSTYRSDKNFAPGRQNCITSVCQTLDEDLARRDFTFNALAVCPYSGEVIDPFDGRKDLDSKVVKFVGNPVERINEDYLRMIRAARFTCLIEGSLDGAAFNAIRNHKYLVRKISPERIRIELLKVMEYKRPSIFFDILHSTGILKILFPELDAMYGFDGGIHHSETLDEHFKITGDALSPKVPLLRLIGYFHDIGKVSAYLGNEDKTFVNHEVLGAFMIKNIFTKYKFTNKEVEKAEKLVLFHMRSFDSLTSGKAVRKLLRVFTEENVNWKEWLKLKVADKRANLAKEQYKREHIKKIALKIHKSKKAPERAFSVKDLKISGYDVMETLNIKPGNLIGTILKILFERVLDEPELNDKDKLLEILRSEEWVKEAVKIRNS